MPKNGCANPCAKPPAWSPGCANAAELPARRTARSKALSIIPPLSIDRKRRRRLHHELVALGRRGAFVHLQNLSVSRGRHAVAQLLAGLAMLDEYFGGESGRRLLRRDAQAALP